MRAKWKKESEMRVESRIENENGRKETKSSSKLFILFAHYIFAGKKVGNKGP
jgi:hypothetical protein